MSAISFFGYFFLGVGPGIVFFAFFIAPKSFLLLISLFSTFLWLTVLLVISAIFRGFEPIDVTTGSYAGVLLASVLIEEGVRYLVWRVHRKSVEALEGMSRSTGHRFALIDKLYMALAWGFGHGACHTVFFFLSLLPLTGGDGTFYPVQCPAMSLFLTGALLSLAFGMVLTCAMVVAVEGYHTGNIGYVAMAPAMHVTAALMTLGNLQHNGCLVVTPLLLAMGVASVVFTVHLCWSKGFTRPGRSLSTGLTASVQD